MNVSYLILKHLRFRAFPAYSLDFHTVGAYAELPMPIRPLPSYLTSPHSPSNTKSNQVILPASQDTHALSPNVPVV
jgi:hypothetical protein